MEKVTFISEGITLYWSAQGTQTDYYDRDIYTDKAAQIAAVHFKGALR